MSGSCPWGREGCCSDSLVPKEPQVLPTEVVPVPRHQKIAMFRLEGCLQGGRKILTLGRSEKAEKLFVCFTCRNFSQSGYQVENEKKNNCLP